MPFSFLPRASREQLEAARLDAESADRVAAVMRETNAVLEGRIRQLQARACELERENVALRAKAETAAEAHLLKSHFLQQAEPELRASHEAVVGFARLMWEDATIAQRPMLGSLLAGLERIGRIAGQMAQVAPLESKGLAFDDVEAAELIGAASKPVARAGVALEMVAPEPVKVRADANWIRHALTVLLTHAIERGGPVAVSAVPKGASVRFAVEDRGPHLDACALDEFVSQPEIALCRRVVELHGGALQASSTPAAGCTVAFTLPVVQP